MQKPTSHDPQPAASHRRLFGWLSERRAWIAAAIGIIFILSTLYVLWAVKDLPDPSQDVLAVGDIEATAEAIREGLAMSSEERRKRNEAARNVVRTNDISRWITRQVQDIRDLVATPGLRAG